MTRLLICRLVEALEMYDNPHMDSYLSDEQDPDLGGGLGSIHAFGGMGLGDDMDNDEKALLGPTKRGKVGVRSMSRQQAKMLQRSATCAVGDMLTSGCCDVMCSHASICPLPNQPL